MLIKEFELITTQDKSNKDRGFRSRAYEYERILDKIDELKPKSVHNTACWLWDVHIRFSNELSKHCDNVFNSDDESWVEWEARPKNFFKQDITKKLERKFDCVLCISTWEHLPTELLLSTLENLLDQTEKDLLITFDYPSVDIQRLENILNCKCIKEWEILNWSNSVVKQDIYSNLNCVLLHIQK